MTSPKRFSTWFFVFSVFASTALVFLAVAPESHAQDGYEPDYSYTDTGGGGDSSTLSAISAAIAATAGPTNHL